MRVNELIESVKQIEYNCEDQCPVCSRWNDEFKLESVQEVQTTDKDGKPRAALAIGMVCDCGTRFAQLYDYTWSAGRMLVHDYLKTIVEDDDEDV